MIINKKKKVVVIGGGTGTFVALSGLKKYPVELSAIITMMDSGGSTGRLRDQLGVLPPGDVRQALVALSESDNLWRDLFVYRFSSGDLSGHNFGNIFLSALEKTTGSIEKAINAASYILDTKGTVIPVTFTDSQLCVELVDGTIIEGETQIDEPKNRSIARIKHAYLVPSAKVNKKVVEAIEEADMVVIGPGDLYTSIIPNLLVNGVVESLHHTKAICVFVMNLMTKYGQTTEYTAQDHLDDLSSYVGNAIDVVLINAKKPDNQTLAYYQKFSEKPVDSILRRSGNIKTIKRTLLDTTFHVPPSSDALKRSLIRHDPQKLARTLMDLL